MITWTVRILGSLLLADFLSGLAHWIEDSYFTPETRLIGRTIAKNVLHHGDPQAFVVNPWHVTIRSSLFWAVSTAVVIAPFGLLGPVWIGALCIAVFANQVHKWAHMNPIAVPGPVRWLQNGRVLLAPLHHARHHRGGRDTQDCVVTNVLNPILDRVRLWRALERLVRGVSGYGRRPEVSLDAAT